MEKTVLEVQKRTLEGKKVKKIRKDGLIPANLFGKKLKSVSLQLSVKELLKIYKKVGETGLVELQFDGSKHNVLISDFQIDPVSRKPYHVQFHEVSLTEKLKANVPLELVGESPAVKDGVGLLLQTLNEVEVEALPTDLPEKIEVNVDSLTAVDQQVTVGDLKVTKAVVLLTPLEEIVVKVAPAISEEAKKEAEAAEAAASAAALESAAAPASSPTEGEAKPEDTAKE